MRALVIGARGAVGAAVVSTLREHGHQVNTAGRNADGYDVVLDLSAAESVSLEPVTRGYDVVINASGMENVSLGRALGDAVLIDISATGSYLAELAASAPLASIVLGAGLVPGLSTVLIAELQTATGDSVDVAVMLGSGEKHGAAALAWTARLVGNQITDAPSIPALFTTSPSTAYSTAHPAAAGTCALTFPTRP